LSHPPNPSEPSEREELVEHLERDQLVQATSTPLPPATLSPATLASLWALRVFVVLVSAMVMYVFVSELR
jgi:hypothetical protein